MKFQDFLALIKKSFGFLKRQWMKFAKAVGWFNTRLILLLIYFIFVGVYSLFYKTFKTFTSHPKKTFWIKKTEETTVDSYRKQF